MFLSVVVPMPMLQVVQIALMVVGLFFETDVEVGLDAIAKFDKEEEPLDNIPKIEPDKEQFPLVGGMNALMVKLHGTELLYGEDNTEEVDGIETTLDGKAPDMYDLCHRQ